MIAGRLPNRFAYLTTVDGKFTDSNLILSGKFAKLLPGIGEIPSSMSRVGQSMGQINHSGSVS